MFTPHIFAVPDDERPFATLYARLSREAGITNVSKDGMIKDLIAAADRFGYRTRPDMIHIDDGLSGAIRNRKKFFAWLADAKEGRAACLLGYHTDRLSREGVNVAGMILDVVEGKDSITGQVVRNPVRLLDYTGNIDSESGDGFRLNFVIQAEIGRAERERIRSRGRDRNRRLRPQLRWTGGPAPYGFKIVPMEGFEISEATPMPPKTLAINEAEAAVVREAARRVLAEKHHLGRVARYLNDAGHKPRRAVGWNRVTVRQILTSDIIAGRVTIPERYPEIDPDTRKPHPLAGHRILGKGKRPIYRIDPKLRWPKVLDYWQVLELRRILKPTPDPTGLKAKRGPARLLTHLVTCWDCEETMGVAARSNGTVAYLCQTRSQGGTCSGSVTIDAPALEDYISGLLMSAAGHTPNHETRVIVTGTDDLARVEIEIADLQQAFGSPGADYAVLGVRMAELQAERTIAAAAPVERREEIVPTGDTLADTWAKANTDDRRDLIKSWFGAIVVKPAQRGGSRYRGMDLSPRVHHEWSENAAQFLVETANFG